MIEPARDSIVALANEAYDEIDGKSGPQVGESIPANVNTQDESHVARWVILGVSAAATVAGVVLAVSGDKQAKEARDEGFSSTEEYKNNKDKAHNGQILRGVGIGVAIAGAVGIGLSFAF